LKESPFDALSFRFFGASSHGYFPVEKCPNAQRKKGKIVNEKKQIDGRGNTWSDDRITLPVGPEK
jgi:hypothetical protein